jgi:hypothetical protein
VRRREKFDPGFKVKGYKVILPPGKGKDPDILGQALRILANIVKEKGIFYEKKN